MALAHQYSYMNVQIGTVDFTPYLANTEQVATMPIGAEVGRATLSFRNDGTLPTIPKWGTVVIKAGTAAPGTPVWGGYATRQSSEPASMHGGTVSLLTVDCQSYAIRLSTTEPISETYGGGDYDAIILDNAIVANLVETYLPEFYDAGSISNSSPVQCDYIQFSEETLRSALNKIEERSDKEFGITAGADFYYRPRNTAVYSDHKLSDLPDYSNTWPMQAKPYSAIDDVEVRNAVKVVGGWTLSAVQDETFLTDGITYSFQVAYFPQDIIRVRLANIVLSVGVYLVDPPADFDVLVHYDQRRFIFQLPPDAGKTLEIEYRYPVRVEEVVTDAASIAEVGGTIWGPTIQDSSISQASVAQTIGSAYLARATASNVRGQVTTTWAGTASPYLPGQIVQVYALALQWEEEPLEIQAVTMRFAPRPGGNGVCLTYWDLDVGSIKSVGHTLGEMYRDAPEVRVKTFAPDIRAAITAGDVPTLDHGTALSGLGDDDHTQYLLATGARTGASSQAQTFTNGIIGPSWKPASDSTTALQLKNASGTVVVDVDTTNSRMGLNASPPYTDLDIGGNFSAGEISSFCAYAGLAIGKNINGRTGMVFRNTNSGNIAEVRWLLMDAANDYLCINHAGAGYSGNLFGISRSQQSTIFTYSATGIRHLVLGTYSSGDDIVFGIANVEQARLQAGYFGVGTATPLTKLHANVNDTLANTVVSALTLSHDYSSGTPGVSFGVDVSFLLKSSTTSNQAAARMYALWQTATHASRAADLAFLVSDYAAEREVIRIRANGSAPALGFWASAPATKQTLAAYTTDPESSAYTGAADGEAKLTDLNSLRVAYENLRAMVDDLRTKLQTTTLVA